jgi:hypothetical protein
VCDPGMVVRQFPAGFWKNSHILSSGDHLLGLGVSSEEAPDSLDVDLIQVVIHEVGTTLPVVVHCCR